MIAAERQFTFGTKAETLKYLSSLVSSCHIPRFYHFTLHQWNADCKKVVNEIQSRFTKEKVIVRSSAVGEDGDFSSMAGYFDSVADVPSENEDSLSLAISKVIESYNKLGCNSKHDHQVIVQLMVTDISMSGVLFTQDLNTGSPYYVINYDDETGRTDTVTAGISQSNRTLLVHRSSANDLKSERFRALLQVVREIEEITSHDSLDIEFAVDKNNKVYLFQVRPLATKPNWNRGITLKVNDAISRMKSFVASCNKNIPGLHGSRSIFTLMSDWNPAEMIGTSPRPLALSLYRYLITDFAWREARRQMGYNEPKGTRLLVDFCGKPYIDIRQSFNSFLPSGLNPAIGEKLVNAWLDRLSDHKELHDKIEFEVVTTAMTFDFDDLAERQFPGVLTASEYKTYKSALFNLTNDLLCEGKASISGELANIESLIKRRNDWAKKNQKLNITVVASLLEDCIKLGTIPFSILARHAFIATSLLKSLVSVGVIGSGDADEFKKSIKTVASEFVGDINDFSGGKIGLENFMNKYGHLRPGTYDILSKRYDQREDLLNGDMKMNSLPQKRHLEFSDKQMKQIEKLLKESSFGLDVEQLIKYIQDAIAAREYAKFIFTKNISDALEIIALWGEDIRLSRDELSFLKIEDVLDTINVVSGRSLEQHLRNLANEGKKAHELTTALRLPYIIEREEDISIVPLLLHRPNFISGKIVRGKYVYIDGKNSEVDLNNKIVLIESADPGFDWIFSRKILGLVTKFGGANSHMAIRCAEFGLPAAIGCGEQIFDRILRSGAIELNCSEGRIEPTEI